MRSPFLSWLYLLNATALILHQIDSAYWHEWQLFSLPGGIQLFLCINFFLLVLVLLGYRLLLLQRHAGIVFSWLLVASGVFAVVVHSYFICRGSEQFTFPASLAILALIMVLSVLQAAATVRFHLVASSSRSST